MPEESYPALDPSFGHWLAGFIDGEATFIIRRLNGGKNLGCLFNLILREDEREIISEIHSALGVGIVSLRQPQASASRGSKPGIGLRIETKDGCKRLVDVLDAFPLRAKKARDYAIWREAVLVWQGAVHANAGVNAPIWRAMDRLRVDLVAVRAYDCAPAADTRRAGENEPGRVRQESLA